MVEDGVEDFLGSVEVEDVEDVGIDGIGIGIAEVEDMEVEAVTGGTGTVEAEKEAVIAAEAETGIGLEAAAVTEVWEIMEDLAV
jgi:hypothetical protein